MKIRIEIEAIVQEGREEDAALAIRKAVELALRGPEPSKPISFHWFRLVEGSLD